AGHQARSGIQSNPTGTRQINLTPGVEVGEVFLGPAGAIERFDVGSELDQIAGNETGRQAEAPQHLDQQPTCVATGAAVLFQRLVRSLNARLEADEIFDIALQPLIDRNEEIDSSHSPIGSRVHSKLSDTWR